MHRRRSGLPGIDDRADKIVGNLCGDWLIEISTNSTGLGINTDASVGSGEAPNRFDLITCGIAADEEELTFGWDVEVFFNSINFVSPGGNDFALPTIGIQPTMTINGENVFDVGGIVVSANTRGVAV